MSVGETPALVLRTIPSLNACRMLDRTRFWRELGVESHARTAAIVELLAHDFEQGQDGFEDLLVAADHKGQGGIDRAGGGTGDGRAQEVDSGLRQSFSDTDAGGRADGAGIDHGHALSGRLQDSRHSYRAKPVSDHRGIADAKKHNVGLRGNFGGSGAG